VTFRRVDPGAARSLQPHRRLSHQDPQPHYGRPARKWRIRDRGH